MGTPLMQSNNTVGIDLPRKFLIFEEEEVFIAFNDPMYLKERHAINGKDDLLAKMSNTLKTLSETAAK